jgi:hypothetical protein
LDLLPLTGALRSISPQNFSVDMELVRTNHRGAVFGTSIHPLLSGV